MTLDDCQQALFRKRDREKIAEKIKLLNAGGIRLYSDKTRDYISDISVAKGGKIFNAILESLMEHDARMVKALNELGIQTEEAK